MVNKKNEDNKIKYLCPMCLKDFGNRKDNYQTHLNKTGCGIGITKLEEIIKQNEKNEIDIIRLKEENIKLKEENESLKQQMTVNNTNITNIGTVNNYILQINNFNKTSYEGIIKNLLKYIGKSIYINTIKDIYLNNEKPENHNIYVADKNRGIVKIWNDGVWQSKNMIVIDQIIDNIVKHFNLSIFNPKGCKIEEIKKDNEKYEKLKQRISNKINYIQLCDLEYLDELEEEPLDNKDRIQRCKDFRDLVFEEIKTLLHDNKQIVKESHKRHKINKVL